MPTHASQTALPVVAVVGRPNVGKSTLFNRFVGRRQAIVEDRARTTRDRMYGDAEWNGRRFVLVDTGGLEVDPADPIELKVQEQARLAIREADVILFLVDAVSGLTPADLEAAELLRKATKPILVAVNKVDNTQREADAAEFWSMGWEETYSISASHGRGTGDLLDAIVWALPPESEGEIARKAREDEADEWARDVAAGRLEPYVVGVDSDTDDEAAEALDALDGVGAGGGEIEARWDAAIEAEADDSPAAIAFVGRPNVGKSSLLNALLGEDRAIVSEVPGTTRDAIDTPLAWGRSEVILIDTAGIRRRGKVASGPAAERFSTLRALKAIGRADVAVLVIDAVEGLTAQDAHVAGYIVEEGKGLVIAVNKWDLVEEKTGRTFDQYVEWIQNDVPFLDFAPVVSISAKTGQRVGRVLEMAIDIWGERRKRVSTAELNRVIRVAVERQVPPVVKNRRPKIFYGTQAAVAPPTFVFFANDAASIHFSYRRYLENQLRESFGYHGTPIRLIFRDRESVRLPRRRAARGATGRASTVPGARRPASGGLPAGKASGGKASGCEATRQARATDRRRAAPEEMTPAGETANPRVAVVGAGAWGTTLAVLVGRAEPVVLLAHDEEAASRIDGARENARRLPGVALPPTVHVTADPAALAGAADLVIFAVPSAHLRATVERLAPHVAPTADLLSVVKGLETGSLLRMTEVIASAGGFAPRRLAALSGPNLAGEIARGLPASAVVAAEDPMLADRIVERLGRREFRLYVNSDVLGVELCGALKNVVAIAAGAADGLGFGDNGKAGLMTRGLAEMTRLGVAIGANPVTFAGLAGVGDVIATCGSTLSRNHRLGEELAKGRSWTEIELALPGVAEGAYTVDAAIALAARHNVEMPIAQEVHNALFEGKSVQRCLIDLLARESKDELADAGAWAERLRT